MQCRPTLFNESTEDAGIGQQIHANVGYVYIFSNILQKPPAVNNLLSLSGYTGIVNMGGGGRGDGVRVTRVQT